MGEGVAFLGVDIATDESRRRSVNLRGGSRSSESGSSSNVEGPEDLSLSAKDLGDAKSVCNRDEKRYRALATLCEILREIPQNSRYHVSTSVFSGWSRKHKACGLIRFHDRLSDVGGWSSVRAPYEGRRNTARMTGSPGREQCEH